MLNQIKLENCIIVKYFYFFRVCGAFNFVK